MGRIKIGVCALAAAALFAIPASAQNASSASTPPKSSGHLENLSKKARAGDTKAQLRMGLAFEFGQGVQKDSAEAMRWYRMAADRGDPVAQADLGYLYESGAAGPKDPGEAAKWYTRAAVTGLARAKFNLGVLYLKGEGVQKNNEEAEHWIGEAADAGCPDAVKALSYIYRYGWGVSPDPQKAAELSRQASKKNDAKLCMNLDPGPVAEK